MKMMLKCINLLTLGLFTAIIIYPLLHELGHSIAVSLTGNNLLEFNIFPQSNIKCEVVDLTTLELIFIVFSGFTFPIIIGLFLQVKTFNLWYISFILKGISLINILFSFVSVIMFSLGKTIIDDDMTIILTYCKINSFYFYVNLLLLLILLFFLIYFLNPSDSLKRILKYYQ